MRESAIRECLESVFRRFDGERYRLHSWVIMPNHAHLLVSLKENESLEKIMNGWKGVSARKINRLQRTRGVVWMKDYFDRMIRDAAHFWRVARYIRRNPTKAKLTAGPFTLFESDHVRDVSDGKANG